MYACCLVCFFPRLSVCVCVALLLKRRSRRLHAVRPNSIRWSLLRLPSLPFPPLFSRRVTTTVHVLLEAELNEPPRATGFLPLFFLGVPPSRRRLAPVFRSFFFQPFVGSIDEETLRGTCGRMPTKNQSSTRFYPLNMIRGFLFFFPVTQVFAVLCLECSEVSGGVRPCFFCHALTHPLLCRCAFKVVRRSLFLSYTALHCLHLVRRSM